MGENIMSWFVLIAVESRFDNGDVCGRDVQLLGVDSPPDFSGSSTGPELFFLA